MSDDLAVGDRRCASCGAEISGLSAFVSFGASGRSALFVCEACSHLQGRVHPSRWTAAEFEAAHFRAWESELDGPRGTAA